MSGLLSSTSARNRLHVKPKLTTSLMLMFSSCRMISINSLDRVVIVVIAKNSTAALNRERVDMGSNKRHKTEKTRDAKKKRHRSRSRSYTPDREKSEKHRHHKKHRRKERKDYDSDVEIVNAPPPPKISKSSHPSTPPPPEISKQRSPSPTKGGASQASLSIEETNKLRAKLGLKPLEVDNISKDDPSKIKDDLGEFYHKPAPNNSDKMKVQKLREKIGTQKEKRQIEANLSKLKSLGECDSDDDTHAWINKSRQLEEEKKKAEMRSGDLLVNVNMIDNERYKRSVLNKLKKPTYDPYDDENFDEYGFPKNKILEKYDEEIDGEKKDNFVLGTNHAVEFKRQIETVKQRLANKKLETLQMAEPKLASEYYNEEELAKFKKPKKKIRKIRTKKKLKADDLVPVDNDYLRDLGSRRRKKPEDLKDNDTLDDDDLGPAEDLTGIKIEEDEKELELQLALKKTQRLKEGHISGIQKTVETIKQEMLNSEENQSGYIVLNSTAEFCRTVGHIPTYGLAGNREENGQELMDFEMDGIKDEPPVNEEEDDGRGAWNAVHLDENTSEPVVMEAAILDAEPSLGHGVGGALKLAMSKGYLQKEDSNRPSASRFAHLQAQNYSIEDKTYGDDDKFGRRDRFNGPTSDFKEKDGFKPNVKLEYIDDDGHVLCAKEAFRYLSHKFHGKGPGKNKVEKRMKKAEQEVLMKRMSSTDTPLGTLNLLQAKQKETQSPYIVLSGSKQMQTTSIAKTKH
ncbi:U4/U6.U5 tri-snRNP-associated protein 1 [Temnothorax longispinosus]|uniref:U4/U6.U5 tri-snRNP-associated protein 1 n=1 Tax=Temnothorax longispinosus TaxID=300112 RepID=A0A4V3SBQ6_9HYME|nr:U4/U6.U5 tri-snRNP-associated protein 1 [Temnothorax longispinosus]